MITIPARAYSQYRNKPKFMAWLKIAHEMGGDIVSAAEAVRNSYDIDSAEGEVLNVIGRIVDIDRSFIANIQLGQVYFADDDSSMCGQDGIMMTQETAESDSSMSDEIFRIAIRAKISKNNGDATIHSILEQFNNLIPNLTYISVIDGEDMSFSIEFQGDVSDILRWALFNVDLIEKPAGVNFKGFKELSSDVVLFGESNAMFGDDDSVFSPLFRE